VDLLMESDFVVGHLADYEAKRAAYMATMATKISQDEAAYAAARARSRSEPGSTRALGLLLAAEARVLQPQPHQQRLPPAAGARSAARDCIRSSAATFAEGDVRSSAPSAAVDVRSVAYMAKQRAVASRTSIAACVVILLVVSLGGSPLVSSACVLGENVCGQLRLAAGATAGVASGIWGRRCSYFVRHYPFACGSII
jgi:hypothetical protein